MWKNKEKEAPILEFLGWILFLSLLIYTVLFTLEPWSIKFSEDNKLTLGYILYAIIGMFFSTPAPVIAIFITLKRKEKIRFKEFTKRIFYTPKPLKTFLITALFCVIAFVFALSCGKRNSSPWYMMPLGFLIMIPFVGIAEEPGWRGFLQPELEKKCHFFIATSITAVIWFVWHLPGWFQPTYSHYNDSIVGFFITIFVWSFVSASIYKSTKSVFACAIYHSFINSIGAIYDWNKLFDAYPKSLPMIFYFLITFVIAIVIWFIQDNKEKNNNKI